MLTTDENDWLNATPLNERRSITKSGVEYSIDRRIPWPVPSPPASLPYIAPPFEIGTPAPWTAPRVHIVPDYLGTGGTTVACPDAITAVTNTTQAQ